MGRPPKKHEVSDLTPHEDEGELEFAQRIQSAEQESFDLGEFIADEAGDPEARRPRETEILLLLSSPLVDAFAAARVLSESIDEQLARPNLTEERRAELVKESAEAADAVDAAQEAMLARAINVKLVALPAVAIKVITRKLHKDFVDPKTKAIPTDRLDDWMDALAVRIFVKMAARITRSDGATATGITVEAATRLFNELPAETEKMLRDAMDALNYVNDLAKAGIVDPGF